MQHCWPRKGATPKCGRCNRVRSEYCQSVLWILRPLDPRFFGGDLHRWRTGEGMARLIACVTPGVQLDHLDLGLRAY
jgi:hypothetical protein